MPPLTHIHPPTHLLTHPPISPPILPPIHPSHSQQLYWDVEGVLELRHVLMDLQTCGLHVGMEAKWPLDDVVKVQPQSVTDMPTGQSSGRPRRCLESWGIWFLGGWDKHFTEVKLMKVHQLLFPSHVRETDLFDLRASSLLWSLKWPSLFKNMVGCSCVSGIQMLVYWSYKLIVCYWSNTVNWLE